jgi:hypothetical protein
MAHRIFDIVSEDEQVKHVAAQMQEAAMQKQGGEDGERRGKGRHHR